MLARVPEALRREGQGPAVVQLAVFADLEAYFAPAARGIRDHYQITETIHHDVCILQPKDPSHAR